LKAGLDQGGETAYVICKESPDQIRDAMTRFGIDVMFWVKTWPKCSMNMEEKDARVFVF